MLRLRRFGMPPEITITERFVRLLLLTGQRMREIGDLRWDEIGDDEIVLPASRTKNHRAHHVPLGDAVKAILAARPRNGTHVFGHHGFTNWSTAKLKLDARMKLAPWRIHDLRRTCATGLQRLGVRLEVTEAILNHVSGSRSGVAGVYQRHDFAAEKRTAYPNTRSPSSIVSCQPIGQRSAEWISAGITHLPP